MSMPAMGDDSSSALNATGVNFSNDTQAMDFLGEILDDSDLQISANAFARYFWYGIVLVIGIAALFNAVQKTILQLRYLVSILRRETTNAKLPLESGLLLRTQHIQLNRGISSPNPWLPLPPYSVNYLMCSSPQPEEVSG